MAIKQIWTLQPTGPFSYDDENGLSLGQLPGQIAWNQTDQTYLRYLSGGLYTPLQTQGPIGPQGAEGAAGPTGPQGGQGVQGPAGPTGAQGPGGSQGVPGAQGSTGPQGPQGVAGVVGAQGVAGPAGPQGAQGPAGSNAPWLTPVRKTANQAVSTTIGAVTDLTVALSPGSYGFRVSGAYTSSGVLAGMQLAVAFSGTVTAIDYGLQQFTGLTGLVGGVGTAVDALVGGSAVGPGSTPAPFELFGSVVVSAAGALALTAKATGIAAGATVLRGATLQVFLL
jgi:Collagen triple helix repeat (20 copies)